MTSACKFNNFQFTLCRFFTPTIIAMKEEANLFLLVLSNGGWEGLGKVREKEMEKASRHLGFKDFKVVDDPKIPDGPDVIWEKQIVADHLANYMRSLQTAGHEIGSIVTFDEFGVSYHPNHIQVHHGCVHLHNSGLFPKVDLYTLTTVSSLRKYDSFLDIFLSSSAEVNYYLPSPRPAVATMMLHHTQWLWYRKLFMSFARYTVHNGLVHLPPGAASQNKNQAKKKTEL